MSKRSGGRARHRASGCAWPGSEALVLACFWTLSSGCDAAATDGDRWDGTQPDAAPAEMAIPAHDAGLDAWIADATLPSDAAPRLSELVETLFVPSCVLGRCHVTAAPAGELSFTGRRISVHEALVDAPSSERPDRMRVAPFDVEASYLMEKLTSDPPSAGTRMPPMGALPSAQIERVRAWIAAGALDD